MTALPPNMTAGTAQFWRSYEVTLDNGDGVGHVFGNVTEGASNIRVAFSIERQLGGTGAKSITLTNLSPASIRGIRANALGEQPNDDKSLTPGTGTRVTIKAGYGGALATIFIGNVLKVRTERAGADIHTHVELLDSESFLQNCIFCKTYAAAVNGAPPTKLRDILRDIAAAMQVKFGDKTVRVIEGIALGIPSATYPGGLSFNGTCGQAVDTLLKPLEMQARVRNGELSILQVGRFDGAPAHVLRPDTGLINEPSPTIVLGKQAVVFKSLMNAELLPQRLVTFEGHGLETGNTGMLRLSDQFVGYFYVMRATFKGDTHGQDWTVDCEAIPYDGSLSVAPTPLTEPTP